MGGRKTIGSIHAEAFEFLKKNYKTLWLISLTLYGVQMILGMAVSVVMVPLQALGGFMGPFFSAISSGDPSIGFAGAGAAIVTLITILTIVSCALGTAVGIAQGAAYIGGYDATLRALAGRELSFNHIWKNFAANWKRFVGVTAWSTLWTLLWGLLFFFPGIYKMYCYRLAPYLVLQYPDMTVRQALRKSMEITSGYKGRLFGLDLILMLYSIASVLGICLLFVGTLAIQILWLTPMMLLLYSIVYLDIRQAAIERGMLPPSPTQPAAGSISAESSVAAADSTSDR